MSRILSISNKLLSLRGNIRVTDTDDTIAYQACGEFALLYPTWRVFDGEHTDRVPNATIRRKVFAWGPTWEIDVGAERFQIKRKLLSWTRQYYVVGGTYDGALVRGNMWDLDFTMTHHTTVLAAAAGKLFSLRDRHSVEIISNDEWFVVIAMLVLQIDRRMEAAQGDD